MTFEEHNREPAENSKWTMYLILCCITACSASFQFGYNIGSTNLPTGLIKDFMARNYYPDLYKDFDQLKFIVNTSHEELFNQFSTGKRSNKSEARLMSWEEEWRKNDVKQELYSEYFTNKSQAVELEKKGVDEWISHLWTITTAMFVVGGMIGAFTSKNILDGLGRRNGIVFHYIFTIAGSVLVIIAPYVRSPTCVIVSRFFFGIQGGMSCGLIPTYLSEISPAALRGATGVIHQLCLTIGILVAQTLGFRQILGVESYWHFLLGIPIIPAILGGVCLLLFFTESPRALLINKRDENAARKALYKLRNTKNITNEIEQMNHESREATSDEAISIFQLLRTSELRWPLITGLVLQLTQQLCGINAIFFYSEGIFRRAAIKGDEIQYAVFATGLINVILTIVCVPLIDRLGRKPLLVYPMILIIIDFILLTIFMIFQSESLIFSYLSIVCIIVFIMCFAIGLGPIPFLYVAECFRQDARSAALAICMFTNWVANLILTLAFPSLAELLTNYVFLVFTAIVAIALVVIIKKVPETKGRNTEEIMAEFRGIKSIADRSNNILMTTRA